MKYYSDGVDSHACNPQDTTCVYTKPVIIDGNYYQTCSSGGTRVLALDSNTNAHAERGDTQHNYDVNICMNSDIFASPTPICEYTAPGANCDTNYSCLFGLSGTTNAHLSACNKFAFETKFCCNFPNGTPPINPPTPTCNVSFFPSSNRYDFVQGEIINFNYSCIGNPIANPDFNTNANIIVSNATADQETFELKDANKCDGSNKVISIYTGSLNLEGMGSAAFKANLVPIDALCASKLFNFNLRLPSVAPVDYSCDIESFTAVKATEDSNVIVYFKCDFDSFDSNIIVLDKNGAILCKQNNINCGPDLGSIKFCDNLPKGVYSARLIAGNCLKETYFGMYKATNATVPDYNYLSVFILIFAVLLIIFKPKQVRRIMKK
ncbi:MAG: hypothetical protein WCI04_00820 [archaeon]